MQNGFKFVSRMKITDYMFPNITLNVFWRWPCQVLIWTFSWMSKIKVKARSVKISLVLIHCVLFSMYNYYCNFFFRCFVASLLRCFVASLLRCFVPSLLRSFAASFIRCFVRSFNSLVSQLTVKIFTLYLNYSLGDNNISSKMRTRR